MRGPIESFFASPNNARAQTGAASIRTVRPDLLDFVATALACQLQPARDDGQTNPPSLLLLLLMPELKLNGVRWDNSTSKVMSFLLCHGALAVEGMLNMRR
jgi:hypothetical protein